MKRFILFAIALVLAFILLSGCGEKNVDVVKYAIISLPNGDVVEGEIEKITKWSGSATNITIDGIEYVVHPLCIAILSEKEVTENE